MWQYLIFIGYFSLAVASPIFIWNPFESSLFPNGRIVGGEEVEIEEVPYQVSLQAYDFSFCGGSILSKKWVLTAAHCAVYSTDVLTIRAGSTYKASGGTVHRVTKIIQHEKFKTNMHGVPINDVALMKLKSPLIFDAAHQPVLLFEYNEEAIEGMEALITGWGAIKEGGSTSNILNKVNVPIIHKQECDEAYKSYGGLPHGQICAAHPNGGQDACQGDSGGPLTINGRLAGIVSWGNGCARPGYPGVYTEIAVVREWINMQSGL